MRLARCLSLPLAALVLDLSASHVAFAADGDFPLSGGGAIQGAAAVARDPVQDRFLSAWTDFRNGADTDFDIYGRIVDGSGQPVTEDIAIAAGPGGQSFATIATDTGTGRFLVVWTDWRDALITDSDIYGQIVEADGRLRGPAFVIANDRVSQKFPVAAFDPVGRRFLVAWVDAREGNQRKIYGRYIDPEARPLGPAFRLTPRGGRQDGPALAFDPGRRRFLLAWRDTEANGIYGSFVPAAAGAAAPRFAVSVETARCLPPTPYALAYAPEDDVFLVGWTSRRNSAERGMDVYGALLRAEDGGLARPPLLIAGAAQHQRYAGVAYDPTSRRFLVVWYDLRRTVTAADMDIYGRYLAPDGEMAAEFVISDPGAPGTRRYPALAVDPASGSALVLWEDGRNALGQGRRIFGRAR